MKLRSWHLISLSEPTSHKMDALITRYLQTQTCATICCTNHSLEPYCFNCFYAFEAQEGILVFKSSPNSLHGEMILQNPLVAGTVLPDKLRKIALQGVQFRGRILPDHHPSVAVAGSLYYKKHPLAHTMKGKLYVVQLTHLKMTDNSIVFGNKITWSRSQPQVNENIV